MRSHRVGSPWHRRRRLPLALLTVLAIVLLTLVRALDVPPPVRGHAEAIDGDTLRLGQNRIRLVGLDAPEIDQTCRAPDGAEWPCGRESRRFLAEIILRQDVDCRPTGRDTYGRTLAQCSVDGADLGRSLVGAGWAISQNDYPDAQREASTARRGIWQGSFDLPADWRRRKGGEPSLWEAIRNWFG